MIQGFYIYKGKIVFLENKIDSKTGTFLTYSHLYINDSFDKREVLLLDEIGELILDTKLDRFGVSVRINKDEFSSELNSTATHNFINCALIISQYIRHNGNIILSLTNFRTKLSMDYRDCSYIPYPLAGKITLKEPIFLGQTVKANKAMENVGLEIDSQYVVKDIISDESYPSEMLYLENINNNHKTLVYSHLVHKV